MTMTCPGCQAPVALSSGVPTRCLACGQMVTLEIGPLRIMMLLLASMVLSVALCYAVGLRGDALIWVGFFGSLLVVPFVGVLATRLLPPLTATGDYRAELFEAAVDETSAEPPGTGLDLRVIDPTLEEVHDFRHHERTDRRACPRCGQPDTVARVIDVTHNGNTRVSPFGVERSVADPGLLHVEDGERVRISRCCACSEAFIDGPYPD